MKIFILISILFSQVVYANDFNVEAPQLAETLRKTLMGNLQRELQENGITKAVDFCHINIKDIGAEAGKKFSGKYEFGRTSHKVRNAKNHPQQWMEKYLEDFKNKKQTMAEAKPFFHTLQSGKKVYLEPMWVAPMCLQCHGDNISKVADQEISKRYPDDKARGFKLGDFRGFIWVKEK